MKKNKQAFTLLEILLAVAALVILAGIVILAINPTKQLADTRNSQRWMDVNTVLNAVYQYSIDHNGDLPASIVASTSLPVAKTICRDVTTDANCGTVLSSLLVPQYIVGMPVDPRGATGEATNYTISTTVGNRLIVTAPNAEPSGTSPAPTIQVIR
jgi:type IV pilus assembly protein PilA